MTNLQGLPSSISASVGAPGKARNVPADVECIQRLFNLITPTSGSHLVVDGQCGALLVQRISEYQSNCLNVSKPDAVIDPQGRTFNRLVADARKASPETQAAEPDRQPWLTEPACDGAVTLTDSDFQRAATALGNAVSVNIIKAFATVESGGRSGFGPAKMPVIAYEGHLFRKYTERKYDRSHPLLSYPYVEKAGPQWRANNKNQTTAWATLVAAYRLDPAAALMSTSWGMFQIMGFNFAACGYTTVFDFVTAMKTNAGCQLKAFVGFCSKNPALVKAIKNKDYVGMAARYNGADYGDYDKRIQTAFEAFERKK
ncbi:N-acetylmuramidase family protein [Pseudomonas putida]